MHRTQKIALGFAVVLAAVTALGFILGLTDAEGRTFGIFKLNLFNDILHSSSALWALVAGLMSKRAAILFLKIFGTLYFLDGPWVSPSAQASSIWASSATACSTGR